jgi:hypothetical protein
LGSSEISILSPDLPKIQIQRPDPFLTVPYNRRNRRDWIIEKAKAAAMVRLP